MGFGFWAGYGYPWIIYSGKIRIWILTGIDNRVSMDKLFGLGMGIPDPYPTHGHPYSEVYSNLDFTNPVVIVSPLSPSSLLI